MLFDFLIAYRYVTSLERRLKTMERAISEMSGFASRDPAHADSMPGSEQRQSQGDHHGDRNIQSNDYYDSDEDGDVRDHQQPLYSEAQTARSNRKSNSRGITNPRHDRTRGILVNAEDLQEMAWDDDNTTERMGAVTFAKEGESGFFGM